MQSNFTKINSLVFIYLCLVLTIASAQNNDIEMMRQRMIDDALFQMGFEERIARYMKPDFSKAVEYSNSMKPDGSWADINYSDTDNNWEPIKSLERILVMTHAYSKPGTLQTADAKLLKSIESALKYWYRVNPTSENWYKNDIGKQMYLGVIALLLQDIISDDLLQKMIADQTAAPSMTGSNRTLLATSVFYRGILEKNPERIVLGIEGVMQQVSVGKNEGIQADYSFHQHGPLLYNGNYGSNFLRETIWLAAMVNGTKFEFSDEKMKILRDYYLQGTRLMVRNNVLDYNCRGRHVGRPEGFSPKADILLPQLDYFIKADPKHGDAYERSKQLILQNKPQEVNVNKHFWRSDYTVQHRANSFTSLHMCSKRTIGVETHVNSENMLGYFIPYGLTYIYRRGNEYENIFPVWDWAKLPGVTCPDSIPSVKGKYTQQTEFVGGVSDSIYGVSAMHLDIQNTQAVKSWFWFDKEWVALGTAIRSQNNHPIHTGINQTRMNGEVVVDGNVFKDKKATLQSPNWIWHDSVAYVFPNSPNTLYLEAGAKSGALSRIYGLGGDTVYKMNVFSIWYNHGIKPQNESYEYVVLPGVSVNEAAKYSQTIPIKILSNTSKIQAVTHTGCNMTGIVFNEAGTFRVNNTLQVNVSKPCLLLLNHAKQQITISEPTATLDSLTLTIIGANEKVQTTTVQFPNGLLAGKSLLINQTFDALRTQN